MSDSELSRVDRLIYLDSAFVSAVFEEKSGESPPTQLTRVEGMKAGASISFFSAGLHTQETRTYAVSSQRMLQQIGDSLLAYPPFDPRSFENYRGTVVSWLVGRFTLGEWRIEGKEESGIECFELIQNGRRFSLLVNPPYLAPGFDSVLALSEALKINVGIPVKALTRVLWYAERAETYVACPYLIVESAA